MNILITRSAVCKHKESDALSVTDGDLAVYQGQRAHELELNKATAAFEHAIGSALFLLNGGAAVAFLTLLGASAKSTAPFIDRGLAVAAVSCWAGSLIVAAAAVFAGYSSQRYFAQSVSSRRYLMEHTLLHESSLKKENVLTPKGKSPGELYKRGKTQQKYWIALCSLTIPTFILGVGFAAVSVL